MNYSEEIKKLQARVDELEKKLPTESFVGFSVVEPEIAELTQAELEKLKQPEPRWSFTDDEKTILRNVVEDYNWLVRDEDDTLWLHSDYKPEKDDRVWQSKGAYWSFPFENIFRCIKWSDKEPCEFRKFL